MAALPSAAAPSGGMSAITSPEMTSEHAAAMLITANGGPTGSGFGLGFGVQGLGFRVRGSGFRVQACS